MSVQPRWVCLPRRGDERGWLVPLESDQDLPFQPRRAYWIFGTQLGVRRGLHAHRTCYQAAVCVHGACSFVMDDGSERGEVRLDRPDRVLLVPPMVWHEMFDFTEDCVLLVFAQHPYDEADYIRDLAAFRDLVEGG